MSKRVPKRRFKGFADEWEETKLGKVVNNFEYGLNVPAISYDGENKYIRITDIDDETRQFLLDNITSPDENLEYADNYMLHEGDILFARTGASVGKTYIYRKKDGKVYYAGFLIKADIKEEYNSDFIFYNTLTNNYKNFVYVTSQRSGQPGINAQEYKGYIFSVSSKQEQNKISKYFLSLDKLIISYQQKYDKLQAIKKAYLYEMFPQEGENVPKRRFAGFSGDWEEKTLDEAGYFYYGRSAPKWSLSEKAKTPCVRYGELYTKFGHKIDKIYSFTTMPNDVLRFSNGNEVLIPRVGEDPKDYTHCAWLSLPNIAIGEMISVYNTTEHPYFTAIMFNATLKNEFAKRVEGGSVTNLYYETLKNIKVRFPERLEQEKIVGFFDILDEKILNVLQKLQKLKALKQSYLAEMFV